MLIYYGKIKNGKNPFCYFVTFMVIAVGVFRGEYIGTDIMPVGGGSYYDLWRSPFSDDRIEKGFVWLTYILRNMIDSYHFYYGAIYALNMYFYYLAVKRMKLNVSVFFAILLLSSTFYPSFNTIRQQLGLSIGVYLFSLLIYNPCNGYSLKKNIILYELGIFLLFLFSHHGLFILAIVPLFLMTPIQKVLNKDIALWSLLAATVVIIQFFGQYIQMAIIALNGVVSLGDRADFYANLVENYGDNIEASRGILSTIINGSLAILISRNKRNFLFYIGFVGLLLSSLGSVNLGTVGRIFANVDFFMCLYFTCVWFDMDTSFKPCGRLQVFALKSLRLLFWGTSFYFTIVQNESISPYKTFLFE